MTTTVETRPATEKEKTVFTAWTEKKKNILTVWSFGQSRNQLIISLATLAMLVAAMSLHRTLIVSLLLLPAILFSATSHIVAIMWSIRNNREIQAGLIANATGRISRVYRKIGGLVTGILIDGVRYHVLDAEPVSEGTMVKIAFLPRTRWIVTLERVYKS